MKHRFAAPLILLAALLLARSVPAVAIPDGKIQLKTVVIDPGHGGHDSGCISRDKKTYEKNLTLDIGQRLSDKIKAAYPDVNVIMTRSDDTFITLNGRADVANQNNADLFISIHINSVESGTKANGFSIHCLGQSSRKGNDLFSKNLELCKRENSVIKLEDNYEVNYQGFDPSDPQSYILFSLMQNSHLEHSLQFASDVADAMKGGPVRTNRGISQDPFLVLWRTTMPSVLIEVGFITNPGDLAALRSESDRDKIAGRLLKAFSAYKARYDGTMSVEEAVPAKEPAPVKENTQEESAQPATGILYGTQILATGKEMSLTDPYFKGNTPVVLKSGSLSRYIIGTSADLETARKNFRVLRKSFPDSFLVKIEAGKTQPVR